MVETREVDVEILAIYESSVFNPANFSCNLRLSSTIDGQKRMISVVYNDREGLRHVAKELLPTLLVESAVTIEQKEYLIECVLNAFAGCGWNKDMKTINIEFDPNIGW